jgi:hypothetical protein
MFALAGCGSSSTHHSDDVAAVVKEFRGTGWRVTQAVGMPHTLSGASQRFFLQAVAPGHARLTLQFFATRQQAISEARDARKELHVSNVTTVGDAFVRAVGSAPLEPTDVSALRRILSA